MLAYPSLSPWMVAKVAATIAVAPSVKPRMSRRAIHRIGVLGQDGVNADQSHQAEGHIEVENGSERPQADQDPTDDRTHSQGQTGDGSPYSQGLGLFLPVREDVADHGQRARLGGGRPNAHDHPAPRPVRQRRGPPPSKDPTAEYADSDGHDPPPAEKVAQVPNISMRPAKVKA